MLNGFANVPMLTPSSEITNVSSDTVHNKFMRFCLKIKKPQIREECQCVQAYKIDVILYLNQKSQQTFVKQ